MPVAAAVERKTIALGRVQFKAAKSGAGGTLTGYVSVWGGIDAYGDTIIPGAYAATLTDFITRGALLHEHDTKNALGTITAAREDHHGLLIEAQFHTDAESQRVRSQIVERLERGKNVGLSIGFVPEEFTYRAPYQGEQLPPYVEQVRELRRIKLYESSYVTIPADASAAVIAAKSAAGGNMNVAQRMAQRGIITPLPDRRPATLAHQVLDSIGYKQLVQGTDLRSDNSSVRAKIELPNVSLMQKATLTSIATAGGLAVDRVNDEGVPELLVDLLQTIPTTDNVVQIVSQTTAAAAAAVVEATTGTTGTKLETSAAWAEYPAYVETISAWLPVTRQVLADAASFQGVLDGELTYACRAALEAQILTGDGVRPNLLGLTSLPGTNAVSVGAAGALAAIAEGIAAARKVGKRQPSIIVMDADSWEALTMARENTATGTLGGSALGPPGLLGAPSLWGIPVIPSPHMAAGTAAIGSMATAKLYERMGVTIVIGTIGTMFTRNMVAVRAELRGTFGVTRPAAWSIVSGLPTS